MAAEEHRLPVTRPFEVTDCLEVFDTAEELATRRTIKVCDKRIANFETALGLTDDPDTIAGFARQIERTRAERNSAEIRLRRLTTGQGITED